MSQIMSVFLPKHPFTKLIAGNSTDTSFDTADVADTLTAPASVTTAYGVIQPSDANLALQFFGTDAADETFDVRLVGWARVKDPDSNIDQWTAMHLIELRATLGTLAGIATGHVDENQLWADTLTVQTTFTGTVDYEVVSPANNLKAGIIIGTKGYERIGVYFDRITSATCNAVWRCY